MKPASEFRTAQLPAPGCPPAVDILTDGEIVMQENRAEGQKDTQSPGDHHSYVSYGLGTLSCLLEDMTYKPSLLAKGQIF